MTRLNSWFWVSFVFFGQALCAVVFAGITNIPAGQVFYPILVLFLGGVCGSLLFIFNGSGESRRWKWLIPTLFYGLFIFLMSGRSYPGVQLSFDSGYFHPIEYFTFGLLVGRCFYWVIDEKGLAGFVWRVILVGAVFGFLDELHQGFVPGRDASYIDFILDMAGILVSLVIVVLIHRLLRLTAIDPASGRRASEE